jgi:hypothetical protein
MNEGRCLFIPNFGTNLKLTASRCPQKRKRTMQCIAIAKLDEHFRRSNPAPIRNDRSTKQALTVCFMGIKPFFYMKAQIPCSLLFATSPHEVIEMEIKD